MVLNNKDSSSKTAHDSIPVIETVGLCHVYDGGINALNKVSIRINNGDFLGLIGQNGSGKTTLAKHLVGLLRPSDGKVFLDGEDTKDMSIAGISRKIGFVFQNPDHQIFCPTVKEEISFGPKNQDLTEEECSERVKEALELFSLEKFSDYPPAILGFGLRRKVSLAAVYAMKPKVLILDEPTVGLDRKSSTDLMNIVRDLNDKGHTIVIITHDMRVIAEYTKRSFVLKKGELLYSGKTADALTEFSILEQTQIMPPQVVTLASKFDLKKSDGSYPLTNDEFVNEYRKMPSGGGVLV